MFLYIRLPLYSAAVLHNTVGLKILSQDLAISTVDVMYICNVHSVILTAVFRIKFIPLQCTSRCTVSYLASRCLYGTVYVCPVCVPGSETCPGLIAVSGKFPPRQIFKSQSALPHSQPLATLPRPPPLPSLCPACPDVR